MIVYVLDPKSIGIASLLKQSDVEVWQKPEDAEAVLGWEGSEINPLDAVDVLILEITKRDSQVNYLLAQSILLQKNTLCLYKKTNSPRNLLTYLRRKNVPKSLVTKGYDEKNLSGIILDYIKIIKPDVRIEEVPNIKYTLRLTSAIDRYLTWKSKKKKMNKADFIRNLLTKIAKDDEKYRDWMK